jgi:ubiquinone/menaquinone biosynthesis C-methylase UbiE
MNSYGVTQVDYWDRVAAEKTFSHPLRFDWLNHELGSSYKEATVVDVGCGYGRTLRELSLAGFQRLIGIDFSAAMLARCQDEMPTAGVIQSDGQTLPLASEAVDALLLFAVLTCVPDDQDQRNLLSEVRRVLRPGGFVYISDLLVNEDARNQLRYEQYAKTFDCYGVFELPEGVVVRHHRKEWIDELTGEFQQIAFEPFEVTTMNGNKSAAFQYLGRKL